MTTAWIRSIAAAVAFGSIALTAPVQAQSSDEAEKDRFIEQIQAAQNEIRNGDAELGQEQLANLCLDNLEPTGSNLACLAFEAEYEGQPILFGLRKVACDLGHGRQCASAERMVEELLEGGDPELQLSLMRDSCRYGYALGCSLLGSHLILGTYGGYTNFEEAKQANDRACTLGDWQTCISFADDMDRRLYGSTVGYDFVGLAKRMCPLPDKKAQPDACLRAVEVLAVHGSDDDYRAYARPFLSDACDRYNEFEACAWLWEEYLATDSGPVDQAKAAAYKAKACRSRPDTEGC